MSPLRGFIEECCNVHSDAKVPPKLLFDAYRAWHERYKTKPLSQQDFVDHMKALGFHQKKGKGRAWISIGLKEDNDPEPWDWDEDYPENCRQHGQETNIDLDIGSIDYESLPTRPPRDFIQNYDSRN